MSLEQKVKNAKPTQWFEDIPRWKQWLIVKWARIIVKWERLTRR